jgi:hypothetical protein
MLQCNCRIIKNYSKIGDDQELDYNYGTIKYYSVIAGSSRITVKLEMIKNCYITAG